jgi:hypothetical protein
MSVQQSGVSLDLLSFGIALKQIAAEDEEDKSAKPAAKKAPAVKKTPQQLTDAEQEALLHRYLNRDFDQEMSRYVSVSAGSSPKTPQQEAYENYIMSQIVNLQSSGDRATNVRRIGVAMQNFVAECGEIANKFINGLGVVLGCPQETSAMEITVVEIVSAFGIVATNPDIYQRLLAALGGLASACLAYDLYQKNSGVILRSGNDGGSNASGSVSSRSSGGGTAMPEPDDEERNRNIRFGSNSSQERHTFRHVEEETGLTRNRIKKAIEDDLKNKIDNFPCNRTSNEIIDINGIKLRYSSHKFSTGEVNVGRITVVK